MKIYQSLLKLFIIMSCMSTFGHGYAVKLAVFKNYDGLKHLVSQLEKKNDREDIVVHKDNGLYYAFSKDFNTKHEARSALLRYKKVFSDAYIIQEKIVQTSSRTIKNKVIDNDMLEKYLLKEMNIKEPTYKLMYLDDVFSKKINVSSPEKSSLLWRDQLKLHKGIFYVKYMLGSKELQKKLMKFLFYDGKLVYANLFNKDAVAAHALYDLKKRDMDVYSQDKKFSMKIYLEKVNNSHLFVTMYSNNKRINEAKYYFNRSDALMDKN